MAGRPTTPSSYNDGLSDALQSQEISRSRARGGAARALGREAGIVAFFLLLAVLATRPLSADLNGRTLRGPDPLIDLYTVHWLTSHALAPAQLFGGNVFDPHAHALLHSDLSLGSALLVLPLRPFVRDPVPLYNLAVLLALAFSGWAFHALARALGADLWGALLAGVLAACGSHQLYHVYHLNLLGSGWFALLLLGLHRLVTRPGPGSVVLAACSFALTAQSSGYYAVAATLVALLFALGHARRFTRAGWRAALAAATLGTLLMLPYLHAFLELRAQSGLRRPVGLSARMAFDPARDLGSRAYAYRTWLGSEGEQLFPGVLTLLLAPLALTRRRPGAVFHACAAGVLLVLSLGPEIDLGGQVLTLPYRALFAVAPLDSMRHPYTFAAMAGWLLALLAGLAWSATALARRAWAGALIVLLAVLETCGPAVETRPVPPGLPPAYADLLTRPAGTVLELPVFVPEAMLWAARHGLPTANGIGAFAPPQTLRLEREVQRSWVAVAPDDIDTSRPLQLLREHFRVRYVILPAGRRPAFQRLARAFERSSSFVRLAEFPNGDRLYELRGP